MRAMIALLMLGTVAHADKVIDLTDPKAAQDFGRYVTIGDGHQAGDPVLPCDDPDAWARGVCWNGSKGLWIWDLNHPEWGPPRVDRTEWPQLRESSSD
jgi:hypothetical protein